MKKTLAITLLAASICASMAQAKTFPQNTQRVMPEISTEVTLSNSDVNRIVCESGEAVSPVFSKEKPVSVAIGKDRRSFNVKFKYLVMPGGQNRYLSEPIELFLTCGTSTFELIAKPEFGPPHKVLLGSNTKDKIKDNQALFGALSLEEAAIMLTTKMITEDGNTGLPDSFEVRPTQGTWQQNIYDERGHLIPIEIRQERDVLVDGTGLRGTQYSIHALNNVQLKETMFLNSSFGENVFAITIENLALNTGQRTSLIIIHRESI